MKLGLTSNTGTLAAWMIRRRRAVVHELTLEARTIAPVVNAEAKRFIASEIYAVPIPLKASANREIDFDNLPPSLRPFFVRQGQMGPGYIRLAFDKPLGKNSKVRGQTTKGKYGKWSRDGTLMRREHAFARGPNVIMENRAAHAAPRDALGQPNPPNKAKRHAGIQTPQAHVDPAERSQTRPIRWQKKAVLKHRDFILERRRRGILRAFTRR